MHTKTHREIVKGVANCLGLPRDYVDALIHGVSIPDRRRRAREKHHTVYGFTKALGLVFRARKTYVRGDVRGALRLLGTALHYIHDALVDRDAHYYIERALQKAKISVACEDLESPEPSASQIRRALNTRSPLSSYSEVLAEAVKLTAMLIKAVTWSPPKDFVDLVNRCSSIRREVYALNRRELSKQVALSVLLLLSILGIFVSPLIIAISIPLGIATLPVLVAVLVLSVKTREKIETKLAKEIEKRDARCIGITKEVEELLWYP